VQARSTAAFDLVVDLFHDAGVSDLEIDCFLGTWPSVHSPVESWFDVPVSGSLIEHIAQYIHLLRSARASELGQPNGVFAGELDEDWTHD
jgi:hypothetical protein